MARKQRYSNKTFSKPVGVALAAGVVAALGSGEAHAQEDSKNQPPPRPPSRVPDGFENFDTSIETLFDVYFQGMRVAASPGHLADGKFTFRTPDVLAQQLPGVDPFKTSSFLQSTLPSNEALRCPPGETIDCGVLLDGISGVIVDPDRFRVDLFLARDLLLSGQTSRRLGAPVSGTSLIQGVGASVSANNGGSRALRAGLELSTLASIGRTSFSSRIYGDTTRGLQVDEAYVQHFENEQRWAAGLFNGEGSLSTTTMRVAGVRLSSFYGEYLDQSQTNATALEVVLPRPARVEIYRDGILMSSSQYPGGLQFLDTSRLPEGSYPIRVVVRDASGVILDEVRSFTRAADLPPEGKTVYSLSAGLRMSDNFSAFSNVDDSEPFLPKSTDELVLSASASHRIAPWLAAGAALTAVDGEVYPEVSLQAYYGTGRGFLSAATGPDGQYGAILGSNMQVGPANLGVDVRVVEASPLVLTQPDRLTSYRPFLRDEQSVSASVQAPFWEGYLGLRAAYGKYSELSDRHFVGVTYTQPASLPWLGSGLFRFEASTSDSDTRIGFRFTLTERVDNQSMRSATVGLESIDRRENGSSDRSGLFPVAQVGYTRDFDVSDAQVSTSALAGFSEGEIAAQGTVQAQSRLGEADLSFGVRDTLQSERTDMYLTGNMRTGFVYGDSKLHLGRSGTGDSVVLVQIDETSVPQEHDGNFIVVVDGLPSQRLRAGESAAISLPAFTQPSISLAPDAAPPFDIDLAPRVTPLYPGNVVSMKWQAVRVVTAYGRLVDRNGAPLVGRFIAAGNDIAVTGEGGYFALSAPIGANVSLRDQGSLSCQDLATLPAPKSDSRRAVVNLGSLVCEAEQTNEHADLQDALNVTGRDASDSILATQAVVEHTRLGVVGSMIERAKAQAAEKAS